MRGRPRRRVVSHDPGADAAKGSGVERARSAAKSARVTMRLMCQDMRDMEFSGEFDLAVNLFSSIGYFSDDEDRLLLDRFWRALKPGGLFVLDTRNRDHSVRAMPPEERLPVDDGTLRIENRFDATTSRWHARWWRLPHEAGVAATGELVGPTEQLFSAAKDVSALP